MKRIYRVISISTILFESNPLYTFFFFQKISKNLNDVINPRYAAREENHAYPPLNQFSSSELCIREKALSSVFSFNRKIRGEKRKEITRQRSGILFYFNALRIDDRPC